MKPRNLKEEDLVLNVLKDETFDLRGKMKSRWFEPFIINKIVLGGATKNYRFGWGRDASQNQHG